ncbi:MAG: calcium-binding protein [Ilumatobacteraceae bacterium]
MHHRNRRAHRAVASLAVAGIAALAAPVFAGGTASAADKPASATVLGRTLLVSGSSGAETITLRSPAANPSTIEVDVGGDGVADATVARADIDQVVVGAGAGDDTVTIDETAGVPFTDTIPTWIMGDDGNDRLIGGSGAEQFNGGTGNDVIDGNRGNDIAVMEGGDDEFIWDPGDGSDTVEGQSGFDVMTFNGNNANEAFVVAANGNKLRFTRDVGNIVMDTKGLEQVDVKALGGTDSVRVEDLSRTDVTGVDVDLGSNLTAPGPDALVDTVTVNGSARSDGITVSGTAGSVGIDGLAPRVTISDADLTDKLVVNALGGRDTIDASLLAADTMALQVDAGDGNDSVLGGAAADILLGGAGNDVVDGNRGNDVGFLMGGDDEFIWDPGDGSDIVEGQTGFDVMTFNGNAAAEVFDTAANGSRVRFTRNVGNIVMDTADVERIDLNALGGADALTIGEMSGTPLVAFNADLGATIGAAGSDAVTDTVTLTGTPGDDVITVSGVPGAVQVGGLATAVDILDADPFDVLTFNGVTGNDTVDSSGLAPGAITLG